jgi:hypothetical protein
VDGGWVDGGWADGGFAGGGKGLAVATDVAETVVGTWTSVLAEAEGSA